MSSNKYLIINADGYGFTYGINRGIEETVECGVVTSISVNANFEAASELAAFARRYPKVSAGVHLNPVVGCPLSDLKRIPTLVNDEGEFHYHDFARRLMRGMIDLDELSLELSAQIRRVREMGVEISHLDSHQGQHLYPPYFRVFLQLLNAHGVGRMRTHAHYMLADMPRPRLASLGFYLGHPYRLVTHSWARYEMWVARRQGVKMADRLLSTERNGDKADLARWLQLLRNVPPGWNEVFCHPAYPDDELRRWATYVDERLEEVRVMTCEETKEEIRRCGIKLRSFHDL